MPKKIIQRTAIAALLLVGGASAALALQPPELLRVGANYSAKIVCSNVFIAGRDAQAVLADDVQAPGHPLLKFLRIKVDKEKQTVSARLLGLFGNGLAVYRPGTGCAAVPDGDVEQARRYQFAPEPIKPGAVDAPWPEGHEVDLSLVPLAALQQPELTGPGARAVVVIHKGQLVGSYYAHGYNHSTPLLGWSMTKTVTAALVGMLIKDGKLSMAQNGFWPGQSDPRHAITLAQLMGMSSGLEYNEGYGDVSDVTRMLYLEPDMASYTASKPLAHAPGSHWNYSSGTTVVLSRIWQRAAAGAGSATDATVLSFAHDRLFTPLGMRTAVLEADARGNLVGSSYMYASAQDWARFGQFLLQDGVWQGQRLLPEGYVRMMQQVAPASGGQYGQGQLWRWGPSGASSGSGNPDAPFQLPADTYWMEGHDGQSITIIPSQELVVVRLGLTPSSLHYQPQALVAAILKALPVVTLADKARARP
ncbi:serine hydrolase [Pseudoduganella sp. FT93W]|uniref:Serine hydrolase n=1 Tax=Duganella fentianensis TaxID=2692177 RepID=A0A845I3K7_9BURK|nr:serine hydrolase [Duganella fentianensis]MYN45418.1 serine hydrolase [Duganella fentianensis]